MIRTEQKHHISKGDSFFFFLQELNHFIKKKQLIEIEMLNF